MAGFPNRHIEAKWQMSAGAFLGLYEYFFAVSAEDFAGCKLQQLNAAMPVFFIDTYYDTNEHNLSGSMHRLFHRAYYTEHTDPLSQFVWRPYNSDSLFDETEANFASNWHEVMQALCYRTQINRIGAVWFSQNTDAECKGLPSADGIASYGQALAGTSRHAAISAMQKDHPKLTLHKDRDATTTVMNFRSEVNLIKDGNVVYTLQLDHSQVTDLATGNQEVLFGAQLILADGYGSRHTAADLDDFLTVVGQMQEQFPDLTIVTNLGDKKVLPELAVSTVASLTNATHHRAASAEHAVTTGSVFV